ncbi:microtubule-associated serine/threonine-protein kinase 4-like [Anomaloglossus baeobatrachus]|uniref:microtubule-associated serine/threonine-protein kinase 4-like n=1 Tax=Anomaloglossus baeobatrachus TaxID=238106 RepID=UPI003F4FD75D
MERQKTSKGDSEEGQSLNIPDHDSRQGEINTDLMDGVTVPANIDGGICETPNIDGGICETPEIIHESASAFIGSLNSRRIPSKGDYKPIKVIGRGSFGAVHLVRHKDTNQLCALKKLNKQNLKEPRKLEQAFLERDISTFADCPFVASMFCSFPTKLHLNMVMEYVPGGDCDSLIKSRGPLPVTLARMYIAETVLAVEYLHSYGVVHRDLKPGNLLITSTGHIKVTDFGLSKVGLMRPTSDIYYVPIKDITSEFLDKETFGTPHYMAPEVILKIGYGRPVDWWSVGILLYKFIFGITPFNGVSTREIIRKVIRDDIPWKDQNYCPSYRARDFITELLRKNPAQRLGTGGANEVKTHPFLRDLDFDNLLSLKPLFIPDIKSDEDTHYFNSTHLLTYKDMDSDEDTSEDNDWPEVQHFASSSQRFSKLFTINTEMMSNEEPLSPPECSPENREQHPEMINNEEPVSPPECSPEKSEQHPEVMNNEKHVSPPECFPEKSEQHPVVMNNEKPVSPPECSPEKSEQHPEVMNNEKPVSPPECSPEKSEQHPEVMNNEKPVSPPECSPEKSEQHPEVMNNEEPVSPPECSPEKSEQHPEVMNNEKPVSPPECSPENREQDPEVMNNEEPVSPPECSPEKSEQHPEVMNNEKPLSPPECSPENREQHTEMMSNEEPVSPPECSPEDIEQHSAIQKESSPSQTDVDNKCFTPKNSEPSSSSSSESPVQKTKTSAQELRKEQKSEKVEKGERRRGNIFRRMISSCRRRLSRAARAIRESCIFACCHQGSLNISSMENPEI